jgi:hypothetical protein
MKILYFCLYLWVIFALLNPNPDPATQINADLDPEPCSSLAVYMIPYSNIKPILPNLLGLLDEAGLLLLEQLGLEALRGVLLALVLALVLEDLHLVAGAELVRGRARHIIAAACTVNLLHLLETISRV